MEELFSHAEPELESDVCRYANRARTLSSNADDDDDCDPLGSPERTLMINDDWTVTQDDPLPILRCDVEDDAEEEEDDERDSEELENDEDDLYVTEDVQSEDNDEDEISLEIINHRFLLRKNSSKDSEDQMVPSIPTNVINKSLEIGEESTLSVTSGSSKNNKNDDENESEKCVEKL